MSVRVIFLSGPRFTCLVETRDGVIVSTPPILRKFVGQPIENVLSWGAVDRYEEIIDP